MSKPIQNKFLLLTSATILIAFSVFLISKEYAMDSQEDGLQWDPYAPIVLERLLQDKARDIGALNRMDLDLMLEAPQEDRLRQSVFLIQSLDDERGGVLYQGPFRERIVIESAPYSKEWVTLVFWAFHEKTRTFVSWHSQSSWPVFVGKPLLIELYDKHHEKEDGWYSVRSIPATR